MNLSHELNSDFSQRAVVDTNCLDWVASPSATVWRKRLELKGLVEAGRVTSLVRYEPGSKFPSHPHPQGEEILVLQGVFSDESGDYPVGSYLLNPEGFEHAPFSVAGCTLLVKLRQSAGPRKPTFVNFSTAQWLATPDAGVQSLDLYRSSEFPERVQLLRVSQAVNWGWVDSGAGREIFVMEGELQDEQGSYPAGTWLRLPPGVRHRPFAEEGCLLYVKCDHLAGAFNN